MVVACWRYSPWTLPKMATLISILWDWWFLVTPTSSLTSLHRIKGKEYVSSWIRWANLMPLVLLLLYSVHTVPEYCRLILTSSPLVSPIQGVPGGITRLPESVPYVKVCRYNPKHLYPKLNGYGNNGQRKVRSSCGSTYCTFSADALHELCACRWDWNTVNIMPACQRKMLGTLTTTTALMRVSM